MPTLSEYIQDTQALIKDNSSYQSVGRAALVSYINMARSRVAQDTQCVRLLLSGQAPVSSVSVTAGGTGYTNPTVTVSGGMGTGAVLTPVVAGGIITGITVTSGGNNYSPPLTVTITDTTGSGATATASQINLLTANVGQEIYRYADMASLVQQSPGYSTILDVLTVSVLWGGMKPMLVQKTFDEVQALLRSYALPTEGQPCVWAKFGQGIRGTLYLWQIPSTTCAMDWDCVCLPVDLVDDTTEDAIPQPFSDAVAYYAAFRVFLQFQRYEDANIMKSEYKTMIKDARDNTSGAMGNPFYWDNW